MTKRVFAMLTALTMVLCLMPTGAYAVAEGSTVEHTGEHICEHCDQTVTWTALSGTVTPPAEGGHYYLSGDAQLSDEWIATADTVLCLNGKSVTPATGKRFMTVKAGVTVTVTDCTAHLQDGTYIAGKITGANLNNAGGAFDVLGTLHLAEGAVCNNVGKWAAGAVAVRNGGTLNMTGGELSGNQANTTTNGGAVYVYAGGTLNMTGGTIRGNEAANGGAVYFAANTTGNISGSAVIADNTATSDGGAFYVMNGVKLNIGGGTFSGNKATRYGGVAQLAKDSLLKITGGVFSQNQAGNTGGVLNIATGSAASSGAVEIAGATFTGNVSATNGGVISTSARGVVLKDCVLKENVANNYSTVFAYRSDLTLDGTVITENHSKNSNYGTLTVYDSGALTVKGATVITGNTVGAADTVQNLFLRNCNVYVAANDLTEGARIGVSMEASRITAEKLNITAGLNGASFAKYFVSDDGAYTAVLVDGEVCLRPAEVYGHTHCVCGKADCTDHETVSFMAWNRTDALPDGGNYYLTADVELTAETTVSGKLNLCFNGHTVKSPSNARILSTAANSGAVINLCDCAEQVGGMVDSTSTAGGTVAFVRAGTTLNIYGGRYSGNSNTAGGGVLMVSGTVNMYGGEMRENKAKNGEKWIPGGAVFMNVNGTFNLHDGALCNNEAGNGGAIHSAASTNTVNIYGGELSGNTAHGTGGAINTLAGSTLNVENCTIADNTAIDGSGGAICATGTPVTVKDSVITGNETKNYSAVIVFNNTLTLDGAVIQNNRSTNTTYGAVSVYLSGTATGQVILKGATVITGNTVGTDGTEQNLFLRDCGIMLAPEGLTEGAKIGLTLEAKRLNAGNNAVTADLGDKTVANFFVSDDKALTVTQDGQLRVELVIDHSHEHCVCGKADCTDHETVPFQPWEKSDSLPIGGNYFLTCDVVLTAETFVSSDLNLCLNGHTVKNGAGTRCMSTTANTDAVVNLCDCTGTVDARGNYTAGGFRDTEAEAGGSAVFVRAGTTLNLYGGKFTGNRNTAGGGAFMVTGVMNLYGGEISDNRVVSADGKTWKSGGGIFVNSTAQLNIHGGVIKNNRALHGGGVYSGGTMVLYAGELKNNRAEGTGGGIYIGADATLKMEGGAVSGNVAVKNGGGLYTTRAESHLAGGSISGNSAPDGGGIRISGGKLYLEGTAVTGNYAEKTGGGVSVAQQVSTVNGVRTNFLPVVYMTGGSVSGNTSLNAGGVLIVSNGSVFHLSGGVISGNRATSGGGGVYISTNSVINMYGGRITGNTAKNGGGVYHLKSTGNYKGGAIDGNTAENCSGGIYVNTDTTLNMQNISISKNKADTSGAILCQGNSVLNMKNCKVIGNTCNKVGGGIYFTSKSGGTIVDTQICDNVAGGNAGGLMVNALNSATVIGCTVTGNRSEGDGGGIFSRGKLTVTDSVIEKNTASGNGGAIGTVRYGYDFVRRNCGLTVENTQIVGNTSEKQGGGIYLALGTAENVLKNVTFRENTAKAEGGALWCNAAIDMTDVTVSANCSGGDGYAVFFPDSRYDGMSYFTGVKKVAGSLIIADNIGGDLYLGEKTGMTVVGSGLAEGSNVHVTLASGLLTKRVIGIYGYSGGDFVYVMTAGNRSVTDPETEPETAPSEPEPTEPVEATEPAAPVEQESSTLPVTVAIIAAVAVVAVAAAVLLKKKKPGKEKN